MPIFDRQCINGHTLLDCYEPISPPVVACEECGAETSRVWLGHGASVIPDDIPGGILIRHGLCDPDTGEPVRYYSKSDIAREAKKRGLVNVVEHVGSQGSDKSTHTSRWI